MAELDKHKLSRRRLLGGAGAAAALPVLHELVPHAAVHDQLARARDGGHHRDDGVSKAAHRGSAHRGTVGRVDHAANGFDPTDILRDFDEGKLRRVAGRTVRELELVGDDQEIEAAAGVNYPAWG